MFVRIISVSTEPERGRVGRKNIQKFGLDSHIILVVYWA